MNQDPRKKQSDELEKLIRQLPSEIAEPLIEVFSDWLQADENLKESIHDRQAAIKQQREKLRRLGIDIEATQHELRILRGEAEE